MPAQVTAAEPACGPDSSPLQFDSMGKSGGRRAAKRKPRREASTPEPSAGAWRVAPSVSATACLLGAFLAWRSYPGPSLAAAGPLALAGFAAALALAAGGLVAFALRRSEAAALSFFSRSKPALGALVAAAAAISSAADLVAGRSALAFLCGAVFLGLLYWDRPKYLFALLGADALAAAAAILVPLLWPSLAAGHRGAGGSFAREALALAAASAGLGVAVALNLRRVVAPGVEKLRSLERENRELWDLSFRDGLTGLYNRRFAQEAGENLFARALRYDESFHALMLDIDHFKRVNDRLSHAVGDGVLREIALILQSCVRASDVAARYGGEEFVVFLLGASSETVQFIASRIRDDVAKHRFDSVPWQVTISIGIASMREGETLTELVDRADKSLYAAKRSGRNRVSGF